MELVRREPAFWLDMVVGRPLVLAWEENTATLAASFTHGTRIVHLGRRLVDIFRPVLDLLLTRFLALLSECSLLSAVLGTEEPLVCEGEEELDQDNGENENKRYVEDDLRSDTTDTRGINRADSNNLSETLSNLAVTSASKGCSDILAAQIGILSNLVKLFWIINIGGVEPFQQVQIHDIAAVNHEITGLVAYVLPCEVDIAEAGETIKGFTSGTGCVTLVAAIEWSGEIRLIGAILLEWHAWKIPSHIAVAI